MMSVVIDEVHTEVESPRDQAGSEEPEQSPCESQALQDREAEKMLKDQLHRLEKRQLRLLAD